MSDYAFVAERAKKAFASVARLEQRLQRNPLDRITLVNLSAMRKMAQQARDEMERLAGINQIEVCQYRIVPSSDAGYSLRHVSESLLEYQNLFSQIYDALKNGKKTKAVIGHEAEAESALELAYTYSGSLGVALLAKSDRDFFSGTLDTSIEALYQIIDIDDSDAVRDVAQHLGRAVIKRVHDWSKANVEGGFSADIRWTRSDGRMFGQMIDRSRMEKIVKYIQAASDEKVSTIFTTGMLVAVSLPMKSFQIVVPDGDSYSGRFADDLILPDQVTVGRIYSAEITLSEVTYYATQQEKRTNTLSHLSGPLSKLSS